MKKLFLFILLGLSIISFSFAQSTGEEKEELTGGLTKGSGMTKSQSFIYINSTDFNQNYDFGGYDSSRIYNSTNEEFILCMTNLSDSYSIAGAYGDFSFTVSQRNGHYICFPMLGNDWYIPFSAEKFNLTAKLYKYEEDIDSQYCEDNGLCSVVDPGSCTTGFSQLIINDIEHESKPLININIPDYITWDYSTSETGFDLYIGSGYDVDYINSIVDINSYRPGSEDFTNIFVGGLTLIFPYIFVALLILFIWKLVKRIFK